MEQQVNLYQPILGAEKRLFSARAIAMGLGLLAVCLAGLAGFASWRTGRIERAVAALEQQQSAAAEQAERATSALRPAGSLAELDAAARSLAGEIAAREHALGLVRSGTAVPASGFAARLEALARRQLPGLWLKSIVVTSGDSRLALQGAVTDARLVPAYLAALGEERALDGARFDRLSLRRATPEESPAQTIFELSAPGLVPPAPEKPK